MYANFHSSASSFLSIKPSLASIFPKRRFPSQVFGRSSLCEQEQEAEGSFSARRRTDYYFFKFFSVSKKYRAQVAPAFSDSPPPLRSVSTVASATLCDPSNAIGSRLITSDKATASAPAVIPSMKTF